METVPTPPPELLAVAGLEGRAPTTTEAGRPLRSARPRPSPRCRRLGALAKRCKTLERNQGASVELTGLADRLAALETRGREDLGKLGERLGQLELATEARSYEQAIGCAERGEDRSVSAPSSA